MLYESTRELLFNVVKHACSTSARLKMAMNGADNLRISVHDNGVGFDPECIKGLGGDDRFGLFSIRERLELIGGSLKIESSPGKGAVVSLLVPMDQPVTHQEPSEAPAVPLPGDAAAFPRTGRKISVLLADDHAVMRQGLASLIGGHSDFKVVGEAADGEEAMQMAFELQPDVILMDISMPRMDGMEATRKIHSQFPRIRIIGLSMYEDPEMTKAMLEAGAVTFLTKSGHSDDLLNAIRGNHFEEAETVRP